MHRSDIRTASFPSGVSRLARWAGAFLTAGALWLTATPANAATLPETEVEATLLYHFAEFVDWPPEAFASPSSPIVIGVLGRDPFGRMLDDLVRNEVMHGRPLSIRRCHDIGAAMGCQILYIAPGKWDEVRSILSAMRHRPVLTVADFDGFLRSGGMVQFYRSREQKIRIRVNLAAVRAAPLTISAKLLRVVEVLPANGE